MLTILILILAGIIIYLIFRLSRLRQEAADKLSRANDEVMMTLSSLQQTEKNLLQAEKLASLGRLTAGVAHELRNPLNFIHNFADAAGETAKELIAADENQKVELATELEESIKKIKVHAGRAGEIITTMLQHGKNNLPDTQDVSLRELVDESITVAVKNFSLKYPDFHCNVVLQNSGRDVRLRVNSKSIPLVIGNLLDNAMYAVMQKGKTAGAGYSPEVKLRYEENPSGVELLIEDNGTGLPQKILSEIFEPFYTTKPAGHGNGLGLSICYELLKSHGATLRVRNKDEGGAVFTIFFPAELQIRNELI
jgi:two-component system, NtrC family, sensor kinase